MTGFREFVRSSMNEAVDMSSRIDHTYDNNLQKDLAKRIYSLDSRQWGSELQCSAKDGPERPSTKTKS